MINLIKTAYNLIKCNNEKSDLLIKRLEVLRDKQALEVEVTELRLKRLKERINK